MQSKRYYYRLILVALDFTLLQLCCKLGYYLRFAHFDYEPFYESFFYIFAFAWIGAALFHGVYELEHLFDFKKAMNRTVYTFFTHLLVICFFIVSFKAHYFSRFFLLGAYSTTLIGWVLSRYALKEVYRYYQSLSYSTRRIVVVGSGETARSLYGFFRQQAATVFRFPQDVGENEQASFREEHLEELKAFCLREGVNELYFTLPNGSVNLIDELSAFADEHLIHFRIITQFDLLERDDVDIEFYGRVPIVKLRREPLTLTRNQLSKRAFDLVFSVLVVLLVFPWLYPLIAILIKLESPGPVLFKQYRSGRRNQQFLCYKFRTMRVNQESDSKQAVRNDPRITRIGAFLRKTNLDELPQFLNVLKGEMSVVGPRPHMLKHTEEYSQLIKKFLVRHFITPGITGYAQIRGFRGGTDTPSLMKKRVEHDTWYLENWSLWLDMKIIFLTVWNMLRGEKNAY